MKTLLVFLCSVLMLNVCHASYVLWAGVAEQSFNGYDSLVDDGSSSVSIFQYFGEQLENALFRIRLVKDSSFLDFYYDDGSTESGELGVFFQEYVEEGSQGSGYLYSHYWQVKIPDDIDLLDEIVMELGLLDENDDFSYIAESLPVTYESLVGKHTYVIGSIAPPSVLEWAPEMFYTTDPVPEPSIVIMAAIGLVCIGFFQRNNI